MEINLEDEYIYFYDKNEEYNIGNNILKYKGE